MDIHIGKIIERIYTESGMQLSVFAQRLSTVPRNVYSIFERKELKTGQLKQISEILNHDFFQYYQDQKENLIFKEPEVAYRESKNKISIMVDLDGTQETVDRWIKLIPEMNKVLKSNLT